MTGITQMVLTGADPIYGFRGLISNSNSMLFGEQAGTTLQVNDNNLMSSLTVGGLPGFGTGAFSIEYWVYFTNNQFSEGIVHQNGQVILGSASVTGGLAIAHNASGIYVHNYLLVNNVLTIPATAAPTQSWELETWYHVAISRDSSNQLTMWVNGFRTPNGVLSNSTNYYIVPTILGSWRTTYGFGTTNNFIGRLYNLRIVQGAAAYNPTISTITVPPAPLGLYSNTTKLLLRSPTGNNFQDTSLTSTVTPRAGTVNQSLSTPFNDRPTLVGAKNNLSSPFNTAQSGSILLRGINTFAFYTGGQGMAFGTGDFTIEWFSFSLDQYAYSTPWWYGTTASPTIGISFEVVGANTNIKLYFGGSNITLATVAKSTYDKKWVHWALVRISGILYYYRDGVLLNAGGTAHNQNYTDVSSNLFLGKKGLSAQVNEAFVGPLTNFRVSKGVGVYTGSFTRPTSNLLRIQTANPYGGSNTSALRSDQVPYLLVP